MMDANTANYELEEIKCVENYPDFEKLMHIIQDAGMYICMHSRDAQKQLVRTSSKVSGHPEYLGMN